VSSASVAGGGEANDVRRIVPPAAADNDDSLQQPDSAASVAGGGEANDVRRIVPPAAADDDDSAQQPDSAASVAGGGDANDVPINVQPVSIPHLPGEVRTIPTLLQELNSRVVEAGEGSAILQEHSLPADLQIIAAAPLAEQSSDIGHCQPASVPQKMTQKKKAKSKSKRVTLNSCWTIRKKRNKRPQIVNSSTRSRTTAPKKGLPGARRDYQIALGEGLPNPIFDQVCINGLCVSVFVVRVCACAQFNYTKQRQNCFRNSIALLMRLINHSVYVKLIDNKSMLQHNDIYPILNQGGYYLTELPLYFPDHSCRLFKPEMPALLGEFLQTKFGVYLPWLNVSHADQSQLKRRVSEILSGSKLKQKVFLPLLLLIPFNKDGVALRCVGLDCRGHRAVVWDPANVNSFEFTLPRLNELCDGKWTPSFQRIWCVCSRNS
jgi:hypothetical protein